MTNAWPWWEKSKATVFPACSSWLNFRVRGQFEIKILIVRHINTTYFIWIFKKIKLEPAIIWKLVTCQRITSKRYSTSMGRHLSPRYGQVILVSRYLVLTAVNWSQHWCPICVSVFLCSDPKLAKKYEIEHCSRYSKTINWSADSFQINHVTSMSWHISLRYGHMLLVSGYPVLAAVNWPFGECLIYKMCTCQETRLRHPSIPFGSLPYPTLTICRRVRTYARPITWQPNEKRLTIFYEYGALSHARVGAPLIIIAEREARSAEHHG